MYDLIIKNGTVVNADSCIKADVAVQGEKIAAIGTDLGDAAKVIDAEGKLVIPGGVDPHVHINFAFGNVSTQSTEQASRGCAYGGTTTAIDFSQVESGESPVAIAKKKLDAMGGMCIDYGIHLVLNGKQTLESIAELGEVIKMGLPSIKMFMNYFEWYPGDGALYAMLKECAKHGGIGIVHQENGDIMDWNYKWLQAEGKTGSEWSQEVRPAMVEEEAARRAIFIANHALCCRFTKT